MKEIIIIKDYKSLKKGTMLSYFLEKDKGFYCEFAGEFDTEVVLIPREFCKKMTEEEITEEKKLEELKFFLSNKLKKLQEERNKAINKKYIVVDNW